MEQRVRIRDIAEELGLSTATVSNVIHGKTQKISDATVRRVQQLLEERQYIPSMAGILLAQNASRIVGVFVNDHEKYEGHTLEDAFIAAALNALSTEIEAQGLFMMVKKTRDAQQILSFASMWNMDGLVVIGFCQQDYQYLRDHMHIPFVVYDGVCENPERIINLKLDDRDGGRQMGEHFRALGHRRALCLADNCEGVDRARIEGFCAAFGAENTEFWQIPMQKQARWAEYQAQMARFGRVTAVFAASDVYAVDLICFLQANGFVVPRDLSVAGFDDIPLCSQISPALTTVKQDCALRARLALEKLRQLREGCCDETTLTLPVELVVRDSTRRL